MSSPAPARRRFVKIGQRQVHYYRAGEGPPALLVHSSPANADFVLPLMHRLASRHTVFAFDNPGFGSSDPLDLDSFTVADSADALAETLRAMEFGAMPVSGSHTGAAIALELAVRHPDLVTGVVLDGVPIFTREEVADRAAHGYFQPLTLDPLGGHFSTIWTRFRDQMTFSPWPYRNAENVIASGYFPTPEAVHLWASMFYRAAKTYTGPYVAAHRFGEVAADRLAALETPGIFTASSSDGLSKHFNRFPTPKPGQTIVRLGPLSEDRTQLIETGMAQYASVHAAPADPPPAQDGAAINRRFVDLPQGQVFVRSCGRDGAPAIVLVHDAPGSGRSLEPLIRALGLNCHVFALDLPGCGESPPLPGAAPAMEAYVEALSQVFAGLGLDRAAVYGIGFGASVALALAQARPALVSRLILRGVLLPAPEARADMAAHYAPPITIDASGAHWYRTWLMLRDSLIYFPWYERTKAAIRGAPIDADAERLHDWTIEVMKQYAGYPHVIGAALAHDAASALGSVRQPVIVCADPHHPFAAYAATLDRLLPDAARFIPTADLFQHAEAIGAFLDDAS